MNIRRIVTLVGMLLFTCTATAFAGPMGRGSGGWGMKGAYQRMYNPATVESVSGEVVSVNRVTVRKGMGPGVHIQLKTDRETIPVHLGPVWYLDRQDEQVQKGDRVEVRGSRVTVDGKPAIIAAEVKKGDATLKLRDDSGFPAWAGWRR